MKTNNTSSNKQKQLQKLQNQDFSFTEVENWVKQILPELISELAELYGDPYDPVHNKINEFFMAELYLKFNKILFEKTERKFYRYDHATGLWNVITEESLIVEVHKFIKEYDNSRWGLGLFNKLDFSICRKIVEVLKGAAEQNQAFSHKKDKFFIHLGNTMLEFSANGEWVTCDFSPDYMSRNRTEIIYNPKAKAERFLTELLQPAMSQDDIETLQLYVGQILLGRNLAQKFLLITGSAGGGKSTLVNIIESLITRENCTQLRLEEGASRFETSRYVGKTLLTAKDVSSQFLNNRNAGCLKALTGGDTLSVEYKGRNTQADVVGNFNAIIVGNSTPLLQTDNDIEAWRRRMLWIKYRRKPTENPIANFDRLLIETQGSGILNWALEGARKLLQRNGKIPQSEEQKQRITELLENADPLNTFVKKRLTTAAKSNMTTDDIWNHFASFCKNREISLMKKSDFLHDLPDVMEQVHGLLCRNDIIRNGKAKRGYQGITLAELN